MKPKTFIIIFVIIALLLGAFVFFQKKKTNTSDVSDFNKYTNLTDEEKTEYEAVKEQLQNYISKTEERGDTPACYASENGERYCVHTTFKGDETDGGEKNIKSKTVFDMIVAEFGLNIL